MKGQVIAGNYNCVIIRQKSESQIQLGELLVSETKGGSILLQVYDLEYSSQLSRQNLELVSGMKLEEETDLEIMDPHLRTYNLALAKPLVTVRNNSSQICKELPDFFSPVRAATAQDLHFMQSPGEPLYLGNLRSGSDVLDVAVSLESEKVLSEHILIPAATGKGKSNLCLVLLWNCIGNEKSAFLVLDPHDEYYGKNKPGLKDHPQKEKVSYYTTGSPPPGQSTLKINVTLLRPWHLQGVVGFSDAQVQAMNAYYKQYGSDWVEAVLKEKELNVEFHEATTAVLKRRLFSLMDIKVKGEDFVCEGVFDLEAGKNTVREIINDLESSKTVILDTSSFSGSIEILVGSIITTEVFSRYKRYKLNGELDEKPVVSVVIEEAPRVLGKSALEKGPNVFSTLAREGRKFKVGLLAITQLPSLIPREILANMNTKIILGIEMAPERSAVIESSAQDLSSDARAIASLDKGEAIITSNYARFATPVKIPLFKDVVVQTQNRANKEKHNIKDERFAGLKLR